jgi:hypothetical protein
LVFLVLIGLVCALIEHRLSRSDTSNGLPPRLDPDSLQSNKSLDWSDFYTYRSLTGFLAARWNMLIEIDRRLESEKTGSLHGRARTLLPLQSPGLSFLAFHFPNADDQCSKIVLIQPQQKVQRYICP